MKAERISIFNYEAFYLDHLEGTLGEEDTALLLQFLADHPELIVDGDEFLSLEAPSNSVVFDDKDSLKVVNDDDAIVLSNVEYFLVAESENQLSSHKQLELNAFVAAHPQVEKERAQLALMFLKADTSIVYADKNGLKRKGAIIFWPYIALAAASVLIAFFFVMNQSAEQPTIAKKTESEKKVAPKKEQINDPSTEPKIIQYASDEKQFVEDSNDDLAPNRRNPSVNENPSIKSPGIAVVNTLERKQPRRILNSLDVNDLSPVSSYINPQPVITAQQNEPALASAAEMKNPIKPITNQLSKTLNQEVDFQTGRAANNRGSGFFIKVGKLEISRKKGKK